jgi:hypothetical protein
MSGYGGKRAEEVATCGKQELRKVHCVADRNQENVALQYHSIIIVSVRPTTRRVVGQAQVQCESEDRTR